MAITWHRHRPGRDQVAKWPRDQPTRSGQPDLRWYKKKRSHRDWGEKIVYKEEATALTSFINEVSSVRLTTPRMPAIRPQRQCLGCQPALEGIKPHESPIDRGASSVNPFVGHHYHRVYSSHIWYVNRFICIFLLPLPTIVNFNSTWVRSQSLRQWTILRYQFTC